MARTLRPFNAFPITTRNLEVLRVADVTPGMRRVTLGGAELAAHTAANGFPVEAFRSEGFDDEFKVILKHPEAEETVVPTQNDGLLNWPRSNPHLLLRTYTVRRWDAAAGELDIDIASHGVGPGTLWSQSVQPGERVQIAGPKSSAGDPEGADWILVAGDETALPAIGRWLETWPAGVRGQVFVEVADRSHCQELPVPDGVEISWLSRDGAEAGTTTLLFDALRAADWWPGTVFAWVAGEAITLVPIRRWLRNEKELPKTQIEVTGYWRRQEVVLTEEGVQDLEATEDEEERFHELSEIFPAFGLRVAATIGLGVALGAEALPVAEIAQRTGTDPTGLAKLLRYLAAIEIVEVDGRGRYGLTSVGRELEEDYIGESLGLDGYAAQRELGAALSLLAAVRTGQGNVGQWFSGHVRDDAALLAEQLETEAEEATYVASALAAGLSVRAGDTVLVAGRAAAAVATALVERHPGLQVVVRALPSEIAVLQGIHLDHPRIAYQAGSILDGPGEPVDAVLLTGILDRYADADAAHLLARSAAGLRTGGQLLVFADVLDLELADDHDFADDLTNFALHGGGSRDDAEHRALFAAAGLVVARRSTIGWGYTLYSLGAE